MYNWMRLSKLRKTTFAKIDDMCVVGSSIFFRLPFESTNPPTLTCFQLSHSQINLSIETCQQHASLHLNYSDNQDQEAFKFSQDIPFHAP